MEYATTVFSALADPVRLRALALMARAGELCVCEFTHALDLPQPRVSKHLAALREAGLARVRRDAQWMLYALSDDPPAWTRAVIDAATQGLAEDAEHKADLERLRGMRGRPARDRVA